jgi:aminoglycoside 3'-phosphotransferase-1
LLEAAIKFQPDADLYGYRWARDNVGNQVRQSIDCMWKPDAPELFLKHGKGSVANDVTDEMVINWLTAFMPLPTIKHFIRTPDDAWLLTTAIPENSIPGIRRIS